MKILIDAMGGDNAPLCVLQGAAQAAAEFGDGMTLALLGDEQALKDCAAQNKIDLTPFEIIPCSYISCSHVPNSFIPSKHLQIIFLLANVLFSPL